MKWVGSSTVLRSTLYGKVSESGCLLMFLTYCIGILELLELGEDITVGRSLSPFICTLFVNFMIYSGTLNCIMSLIIRPLLVPAQIQVW
jgi:hypothetical protein